MSLATEILGNKRSNESDGEDDGMDTDEENEIIQNKRSASSLNQSAPVPLLADADLILHSNVSTSAEKIESDAKEKSHGLFVPKRYCCLPFFFYCLIVLVVCYRSNRTTFSDPCGLREEEERT